MQKDFICRPIMKQGLSSFQIKVIALVCMTLDHLAAIGFDIPIFEQYYTLIRTIGRIAAPLFLFILVQGAQNTRNRKRFILRLYLAGMGCGLFVTATNFFFGETVGFFTPGNILFTFFYVVLYIELIEKLCNKIRCQSREVFGYVIVIVAVTVVPHILNQMIYEAIPEGISIQRLFLFQGLTDSFFPSIFRLPHLSVHSLRHMFATILIEQGIPLIKISALLGHSSVTTSFEYYCDVMNENEQIIAFMNDAFVPGGSNTA